MFYKKIAKNFERWGKKAQKLPDRNEEMKQNILNSLQIIPEPIKEQKPAIFRWLVLATVPALAVLLMFNYWRHTNISITSYVEDSGFSEPAMLEKTSSLSGVDMGLVKQTSMTGLSEPESIANKILGYVRAPDIMPRDYYQKTDITDTREYLKTSFGFEIKTRHVEKMHTRLKTIIRGYGGRIDNSTVSKEYARLTFVLPKTDYDSFVEEVRDMFPKKFITVHENSTNLLGQKQNIEQQTEKSNTRIESLTDTREGVIKTHDEKVASLQKEINRLNGIIYSLVQQRKTVSSTDEASLKKINDQINYYNRSLNAQKQALAEENSQHQKSLEGLDRLIKAEENQLTNLEKQDQNLLNNVETVDGTIEIRWISIFNIVNLYVPIYKIIIVSCIAIILFCILFGLKPKEIELP